MSENSAREAIEVRAPALPAQRFLGGGFGRGAKAPSEFPAAILRVAPFARKPFADPCY